VSTFASGLKASCLKSGFLGPWSVSINVFYDKSGTVGYKGTPKTLYIYGNYIIFINGIMVAKDTTLSTADTIQMVAYAAQINYSLDGTLFSSGGDFSGAVVFIVLDKDTEDVVALELVAQSTEDDDTLTSQSIMKRFCGGFTWTGGDIYITNVDGDGTLNNQAQIFFDRDDFGLIGLFIWGNIIDVIITNTFEGQTLNPIAQIPVLYKSGALPNLTYWKRKSADNYPLIYSDGATFTGVNSRIAYNPVVGGNRVLAEVSEGYYTVTHYFATRDVINPVVGIIGSNQYKSISELLLNVRSDDLICTDYNSVTPYIYCVYLGMVIFRSSSSYTNTPRAVICSVKPNMPYIDTRQAYLSQRGVVGGAWESYANSLYTSGSVQSLSVSDKIDFAYKRRVKVVGNGGAVTLTSTPTIKGAEDGQMIIIQGTSDTNTVTLQDGPTYKLSINGNCTLGNGDTISLVYDLSDAMFYETCRSNN
jgi:hypothetical protein